MAVTKALAAKDHEVIVLSRSPGQQKTSLNNVRFAKWDIANQVVDHSAIANARYIIHLAGASIAGKRWTLRRKNEILESRVSGSALLVKSLKEISNDVQAVISASAIGWYGPDNVSRTKEFSEDDSHNEDFLGQTCKKWEDSITPVRELNKRLVILRTGIVLSNKGGVLSEFKKPLNFGLATILGGGQQIISWIHIDDLVRLYIAAIEDENLNGVYNAVAPEPVTNKEMILTLAREQRGNFFIPVYVPSFVLKWVLGEMSIEVLKSVTVSNKKIRATGFSFIYPTIHPAIEALKNRP